MCAVVDIAAALSACVFCISAPEPGDSPPTVITVAPRAEDPAYDGGSDCERACRSLDEAKCGIAEGCAESCANSLAMGLLRREDVQCVAREIGAQEIRACNGAWCR